MDFGETADRKSVLLVEASPGTPAKVRPIALEGGRQLQVIRGTLAELRELAGTTGDAHLKIIVREAPRVGLADEVRDLFPDAVIVEVERPPDSPGAAVPESRRGRTPTELFDVYLRERGIDDPPLQTLFAEVLEEVTA
jgi:exonuclease SbcD